MSKSNQHFKCVPAPYTVCQKDNATPAFDLLDHFSQPDIPSTWAPYVVGCEEGLHVGSGIGGHFPLTCWQCVHMEEIQDLPTWDCQAKHLSLPNIWCRAFSWRLCFGTPSLWKASCPDCSCSTPHAEPLFSALAHVSTWAFGSGRGQGSVLGFRSLSLANSSASLSRARNGRRQVSFLYCSWQTRHSIFQYVNYHECTEVAATEWLTICFAETQHHTHWIFTPARGVELMIGLRIEIWSENFPTTMIHLEPLHVWDTGILMSHTDMRRPRITGTRNPCWPSQLHVKFDGVGIYIPSAPVDLPNWM